MLRRGKDAKGFGSSDEQRKTAVKAPVARVAGLFVVVTLVVVYASVSIEGDAQQLVNYNASTADLPWAHNASAADLPKEGHHGKGKPAEVSTTELLTTSQPAEVTSKALRQDMFLPGRPEVTYIHMQGEIHYPTALPPPDQVLTDTDWYEPVIPLAHMTKMNHLDRCALVGSHSALKGRGLGKEIDAHTTVIRVNDVLNFNDDVGYKTDIYFATMCKIRHRALGLWGTKIGPACNYFCRAGDPRPKCPFRLLILAGFNASACHSAITTEGYEHVRVIAKTACYPTGMVNDAWSSEMQEIRRGKENNKRSRYWGRPTTGFHAITMFSYLCKNLTLYGFALDVPSHTIDKRHSPEKERLLIQEIVNGTLQPDTYPPIMNKTVRPKSESGSLRFAFLY